MVFAIRRDVELWISGFIAMGQSSRRSPTLACLIE
jgi:hypothetical protein